jgi:hypothetical protein
MFAQSLRSTNKAMHPSPSYLSRFARLIAAATAVVCCAAHAAGPAVPGDTEKAFLSENDTAMSKMMEDMSVKPSGDVDRDFVAMMVPHHQGAIDMAQAELRYGTNEQLRRIAQEIVVEQQQEIVAMHLALGQALPPSAPAPDQQNPQSQTAQKPKPMSHNNVGMPMNKEP